MVIEAETFGTKFNKTDRIEQPRIKKCHIKLHFFSQFLNFWRNHRKHIETIANISQKQSISGLIYINVFLYFYQNYEITVSTAKYI